MVAELHRGYQVFNTNQVQLVDFCELRSALESQALLYVGQRQKLKLVEQFSQILIDLKKSFSLENRENQLEFDTNFHLSFFCCAQIRFLYHQ